MSSPTVAVAAAACLALLTGCRGPAVTIIPKSELPEDVYSLRPLPSPTEGEEPQPVRTGTVYLVRKGRLIGDSRELPSAPTRPEALLAALLEGPREGIRAKTAIPSGARAIDVGVTGNVATVDLSQEFKRGAAGQTLALRVAQVVFTLTEDPNVHSVLFAFEGGPAPVISAGGRVLERPVGRKDYAGFAPVEEDQGDQASMS
jgi:Sporulation and spore germination